MVAQGFALQMAASGFLSEGRPGLVGDKQLSIQENLYIKTTAQQKVVGLKELRTLRGKPLTDRKFG